MAVLEPKIYEWMYGVLVNDQQIQAVFGQRIYRKVMPQTSAYDHSLIMQYMGGATVAVINGVRVYSNMVVMLKATGKAGNYVALRNGMNRADALLHRATGSVPNATILWSEHMAEIPLEPVVYSGETYEQIAVNYRVMAHAT